MSASDLVAQLASAGTPPELLAAVARELFTAEASLAALEARRKNERDRKANQRAKSREVTGHNGTARDKGFNERDNLTSREEIPQEAKASLPQAKKTRPSARLPDHWEPQPLVGKAAAMVACWQAGELERELAKFKNYWLAKSGPGAVSTNWQRNWVNWLINADERKPRHGQRSGTSKIRATLDLLNARH